MIPGEKAIPPPVPPRETQEPREERERDEEYVDRLAWEAYLFEAEDHGFGLEDRLGYP